MEDKFIQMIIGGTAIAMFFLIGYNTSSKKTSPDSNKARKRKKISRRQIDDNVYPALSNPQWNKIGKVSTLLIYPVKSSIESVRYNSFAFFDYGMCKTFREAYFWDGMFLVYNRTRGKFENARKYPLMRSMEAIQTGTSEVTLRGDGMTTTVKLDIHRNRNPDSRFTKLTWSYTSDTYYGSDEQVNTWTKEMIEADAINMANEDIILTQMIPNNWHSTERIKDNWFHFLRGYQAVEEDLTGRLITLPRFVLMTSKTFMKLYRTMHIIAPNIIIDTDDSVESFEEQNWDWIRLGDNVILKHVKPVPRLPFSEQFQHLGIYCALWNGGNVKEDDDVFIHYSNRESSSKSKIKLSRT